MTVVLDVSCLKPFIPQCRGAATVVLAAKVTYNVFGQVKQEKKNSVKENKPLIQSFAGALRSNKCFLS